jgi:lysophospholipase L1-like esterase
LLYWLIYYKMGKIMKKRVSVIFISVLAVFIGYMWFGYANIYNRIRAGGLKTVDVQYMYTINDSYQQKVNYAALGDSLTAGVGTDDYSDSYPYLLAVDLAKDKGVILKDFSLLGARTEDLISKNLLNSAVKENPDIITILIGVNDVRENISEKEFKNNYEYIVDELEKKTDAKIYLISIPLVGSNTLYLPPYNAYFKNKTIEFNEIINGIAQKHNIKYIDITTKTKEMFEHDGIYYSVDSFHPSKIAYKILEQIIYANISH